MTKALSVKHELDGKNFILFGGTGFLGKVWLCLMLDRFPNLGHVYMVVRARKNKDGSIRQSSESRFVSEILTSLSLTLFEKPILARSLKPLCVQRLPPSMAMSPTNLVVCQRGSR